MDSINTDNQTTQNKEKPENTNNITNNDNENTFKSTQFYNYAKKDFWNDRFEKSENNFDWYADWEQLSPYLTKYLEPNNQILMVGCGNSKMSHQMYKDNYKNIINIDISDVVIKKMQNQFPEMQWIEMDATNMNFLNNNFDCVIDKGTLDAIVCGGDPVPPAKLIKEMYRVTKKNGIFCIITHAEPETRIKYFEQFKNEKCDFDIKCEKINLNFMANLINTIRSNSNDNSMKNGIEKKNVMIESVLSAFVDTFKNSNIEGIDPKLKKKAELCLKLQAMVEKYGGDKNKIKENIGKEPITKYMEEREKEHKKDGNNVNIRKNHCFLYIFTKKI